MRALILVALLLLPMGVGAQERPCEDRLREQEARATYLAVTKNRDVEELLRVVVDLRRELERLNDALRNNLPAGQNPGGPK